VDVEPDTWCVDVDKVEAAITEKTKAVIVVHLYGCMPDMTRLTALCKKKGLYLIEDCAHQHGSFYKDKGVGSMGDIGSFSFQESKVLSSGEGGFNTCKTKTMFDRLYSLRNCGRGYKSDMTSALQSGNYRLTECQAAMLLSGLGRLDKQVKLRDANAIYLNSLLSQIDGVIPMRRRKEVTQQSYFNFTFRLDLAKLNGVTNKEFTPAINAELSVAEDANSTSRTQSRVTNSAMSIGKQSTRNGSACPCVPRPPRNSAWPCITWPSWARKRIWTTSPKPSLKSSRTSINCAAGTRRAPAGNTAASQNRD
jgi:L-glutamine:2-deoxy-scyllo-inosose/3-amino-2,3-dideoxy-scyllo-inosose aminotransferase